MPERVRTGSVSELRSASPDLRGVAPRLSFPSRFVSFLGGPEVSVTDVAHAYAAAFTAADKAAWTALFAEDAYQEDPIGAPPNQGREAIAAFFERSQAMAESIEFAITRVIDCGSEGLMLADVTARFAGGGGIVLPIVDHMVLDAEGKISSLRAFFDPRQGHPL